MSQAVFRVQARLSSEEEGKTTLYPLLMRDIWKGKFWSALSGVFHEKQSALFQAMQVNVRN